MRGDARLDPRMRWGGGKLGCWMGLLAPQMDQHVILIYLDIGG